LGSGKKLEKVLDLQGKMFANELELLSKLSDILTPSQAARLAAVLKPKNPLDEAADPGSGPVEVLSSAAARERTAHTSQTYVLRFFGDVQASQVSNLRQEITAVLQNANATRGDEVVLVLNTGGGTVTGYGLAAAQLARLKDAGLKLTVIVEQVAASGGYLMACTADEILASPFAVIGSIGVITDIPNFYERLNKEGIKFNTITAGKFKRTLTPTKKFDPEDEKKTKEDIEQVLVLFKNFVSHNRPDLDIDKVATGETWLGPDALAEGLVDGLTTLDDVLLKRVQAGRDVMSVTYAEKKSPFAALAGATASDGSLLQAAERLLDEQPALKSAVLRLLTGLVSGNAAELTGAERTTRSFTRKYMAYKEPDDWSW